MWIKSIVLDGFKSYAQRTEINDFDPLFNAITGLNGSGKSNILDGICFLLGITNLSNVRVVNLNELVYKNGQGGITKATVSIVFDNTNKSQSPMGYKHFDEITITRQISLGNKNKYLINGIIANNTRVHDLFRSVQLNVNNPHFLIMQGRITKVLNMKPEEILSMIEEATGTRLYDNKREAANKLIEKKNAYLLQIETNLNEEINPKVLKLKEEKASYLEYQKIIRELEQLNKFYIAYTFFGAEEVKKILIGNHLALQENVNTLKQEISSGEEKLKKLSVIIAQLEKKRDEEAGSLMSALQKALEEAKSAFTVSNSQLNATKNLLTSETSKLQKFNNQQQSDGKNLNSKKETLRKLESELNILKEKNKSSKESYAAAVDHLKAVKVGLAGSDGGKEATVNEQLRVCKVAISNAETTLEETRIKLKHNKEELSKRTNALQQNKVSYSSDEAALNKLKSVIVGLESELKKLNYEEGTEEKLETEHRKLDAEVMRIGEKINNLEARFHQLSFEYQDPEPNFRRTSVKGLVAMLMDVKDQRDATALEVVAGGKLYQIVVDTEQTSKKILDRGQLRKRVTFIPLNKIAGRPIPADVIRKAESLVGRENVSTALSLVSYEKELEPAMVYVFGTSFVCVNMESAKRVTFSEGVKKRSVTLAGDSFDPAGIASGGSRQQSECILLKLNELKECKASYNVASQKLSKTNKVLAEVQGVASRWKELSDRLDVRRNELTMLTEKLKNSSHGQQLDEIERLKSSCEEMKEQMTSNEEKKKSLLKQVGELEDILKNKDAHQEMQVRKAQEDLDRCTKLFEASNNLLKSKEQDSNMLKLELSDLEKEHSDLKEQISSTNEAIRKLEEQIEQQQSRTSEAQEKVDECQKKVNSQKDLMTSCNKNIEEKQLEHHELTKQKKNLLLKIEEVQHKMVQANKDAKDGSKRVEDLQKEHPWIADEKNLFNTPNTAYDFNANKPDEAARKIKKLQEMKERLSKTVNMRAMSMLNKAEEQQRDLMKKKPVVLLDRAQIEKLIAKLDDEKNKALKFAFAQVNKDFGSIFSTLLPGASAKLVATEEGSILTGVEFRVGFGDVWKESLNELSGGQRSLVALSLILALLLYKPAPLYILDEVDAALDLSHTQNIGHMLKTHFKHSQFIIVSLKDGMFNNANVLFKTNFIDGVSTISRHTQLNNSDQKSIKGPSNKKK